MPAAAAADVRTGAWSEFGAAAAAIRREVFVEEQRVPAELELDAWDAVSLHALATRDARVLGTGRLLPDGHIGRVAVVASERGRGIGRLLMQALVAAARRRGDTLVQLNAQIGARGFYEGLGFAASGPTYMEAGIEHLPMSMPLPLR